MKFKTIKYSNQYLAKTLFKRTLLFILFLVTICFGFWYLNIFQSLMQGQYSWWYLSPIVLSVLLTGLVGWFGWLGRVLVLQALCARTFGLYFEVFENS